MAPVIRFSADALRNANPAKPAAAPARAGRRAAAGAEARTTRMALPPEVTAWLQALDNAKHADGEDYPPEEPKRLFYVLSLVKRVRGIPELAVAPMTGHLKRDGTPSQTGSPCDPSGLGSTRTAAFLRPADRQIFRRLAATRYAAYVLGGRMLAGEDGVEALRLILATGRARWQAVYGPAVTEALPRKGRIVWRLGSDGSQHPEIELAGAAAAVRLTPPWYVDPVQAELGPLDLDCPPMLAEALLSAPPIPPVAAGLVRTALKARLPANAAALPVETAAVEHIDARPVPHLHLMAAKTGARPPDDRYPLARLSFGYGPVLLAATNREPHPVVASEGRLYAIARATDAEREAAAILQRLGFVQLGEWSGHAVRGHAGDFALADDEAGGWAPLLQSVVPGLEAEGWRIDVDEDFPVRLADASGEWSAELSQGSRIDWFDLDLGILVDGKRLDFGATLLNLVLARKLDSLRDDQPIYLRLPDGRLLPIPFGRVRPIAAALLDLCLAGAVDTRSGRLEFSPLGAADLAAFEEAVAPAGLVWRGGERLREMGRMLREAGGIPRAELPAGFAAVLRPYQARGVDWLQFLRAVGVGGILADDMGLGKTVQALAHLAIEKAGGRMDRPALVVCPTSLVANWRMEAARFAPDLRVLALHGPDRKAQFASIAGHDLVITTYPLLARDHEVLTRRSWHVVVLDEAQTIKNPNAATTRLIGQLEARHRLCLSGTPLENHLGELWSLFSFLSPGFLGDRKAFQRNFRTPIEKEGDATRRALLARRVRPFLLRRTKTEVAADLPAKTEIVEAVEMGEAQRALYEGIRLAMHAKVRDAIAERGLERSNIVILDALLKLRQTCCDPRLLKLKAAQAGKPESAKLGRLMEMLPELVDEGRRVLLFSQFTSMLALIEQALGEARLPYLLLTGDTRDRETPVKRFQDGEVPLFLISLKAGGKGLNLTAADTVIHYDPWWNPAVEDQASDRAHRIGQDKAVFVHKLVMLGTIEQKMDELKARKRELAAGILDAERGATLALSAADVDALFEPIAA